MLQSKLFTRTEKQDPKDELTANAKLLTRGGFVRKLSAGVYGFLPLGWRVMQNISQIIREEMNEIGGQELFLSALVEKKYLDATDRWDVGIGYEVMSKGENEARFTLGWTHEEVLTSVVKHFVSSYKDLPFSAYQIQTKFRNEKRAQGGLLRGREFLMKDLYSFHASEEDLVNYYDQVGIAYKNIFSRCGLDAVYTKAPGGDFTASHTHEFQVLSDAGEDTIFVCENCQVAENKEISTYIDEDDCVECGGSVREKRSIEVGNIFPLGTKYSEALGLTFDDENGDKKPVVMGSYGIGVSRVMGTVAEVSHDDNGIIWPESIAPFKIHLLSLPGGLGDEVYESLQKAGLDVLYDDRDVAPGEKFADADLIGMPWRIVSSKKTGEQIEVKKRSEDQARMMNVDEFINEIIQKK